MIMHELQKDKRNGGNKNNFLMFLFVAFVLLYLMNTRLYDQAESTEYTERRAVAPTPR